MAANPISNSARDYPPMLSVITVAYVGLLLLLLLFIVYHLKYRRAIRSEAKLTNDNRNLADRYRTIFNNPYKGIFLFSISDRKIVEVNSGLCQLLSYSQEELEALDPSLFSKTIHAVIDSIQSGEERWVETRLRSKFGKTIRVTASYVCFDEDGKLYLYVVYADRSEIFAAQKRLTDQKRELDITLKSIAEGVVTINKDKVILSINRMAADYLGVSDRCENYIGKDVNMLIQLNCYYVDFSLNKLIDSALITREISSFHEGARLTRLDDREDMYISGCVSNIENEREIYGSVIVFRDVTGEVRQREELIAARNAALQSDQLKSAFLANMSHEIRTPLNGIVGFANLLGDRDYSDEDKASFVTIINNNCRMLLGLISDILDLSRIESGSFSFQIEECNVTELMTIIVDSLRINMPDGVELVEELPADGKQISIVTDRLRLSQVITNLINNAAKFTKQGTISIGYRLVKNTSIQFFVRDTGCGIPPEDLENIFGRFFKRNEFVQGAGLGLSICTAIVEKLDGTITVTSEMDKGTEFTVTLPYLVVGVETRELPLEDDASLTIPIASKANGLYTLLIAEDDDSNYRLMEALLAKEYRLIRAINGEKTVELFLENSVDLILMDVKMPKKTGVEALIEIRATGSDVPVIMQTAYAFDSDRETAREAGCNDFITKPINIKLLREMLKNYLPN